MHHAYMSADATGRTTLYPRFTFLGHPGGLSLAPLAALDASSIPLPVPPPSDCLRFIVVAVAWEIAWSPRLETSGRSVNWGARVDRVPVRLDAFSDASLVLETGESAVWRQVEGARELGNEAVGLRGNL